MTKYFRVSDQQAHAARRFSNEITELTYSQAIKRLDECFAALDLSNAEGITLNDAWRKQHPLPLAVVVKDFEIDGLRFCAPVGHDASQIVVWRGNTLTYPPAGYQPIAAAIASGRFEQDGDGNVLLNGARVLVHFRDSHDAGGNEIEGGRPSGLHFPLRTRDINDLRRNGIGTNFMTGKLDGQSVISVLDARL